MEGDDFFWSKLAEIRAGREELEQLLLERDRRLVSSFNLFKSCWGLA